MYGVLGTGTPYPTLNRTTPVEVVGITNAVSVTAGQNHMCALLSDGTVKCWGRNDVGQLGNGTTIPDAGASSGSPTPVAVSGLDHVVSLISGSSAHHTCAVLDSGTVECWGLNTSGQLGDGTTTSSSTPVTVTGLE
jgi:alpha-tubulin suppressor-like RCC1 family protein